MLHAKIDRLRLSFCVLLEPEKQTQLVVFVKSYIGQFVLFLIFGFAFAHFGIEKYGVIPITVALCISAKAGKYRHALLPFLTLGVLIACPAWYDLGTPHIAAAKEGIEDQIDFIWLDYAARTVFLVFAVITIYAVRHLQTVPVFRRPILSLILFYFFLVGIAAQHVLHGIALVALWSFINVLGAYFWFLCYALLNQKLSTPAPLSLQLAACKFSPLVGRHSHAIWKRRRQPAKS